MIHENPLGYLLGIQGLALLRAFTGEHGREFTEARIAEIRGLLDDPRLQAPPWTSPRWTRPRATASGRPPTTARTRPSTSTSRSTRSSGSLALTHVPELGPVMAEFARVLRPGGHLVLSDIHPDCVARGVVPPVRLPGGGPGRVATYRHRIGDYLRAALAAGLCPRRCEELTPQPDDGQPPAPAETLGPWEVWPWALTDLAPEAARAASAGLSGMVIWHFERVSG